MELFGAEPSVVDTLIADGEGFVSRSVPALSVGLEGIVGDRHFGFTRHAGGREPWYPRGMTMRNERQLTLVSVADLTEIARLMALPEIRPEWIGANVLVDGLEAFTGLTIGKRLIFSSGAVLVCMGANAPCRFAGAEVARHFPDRAGLDLLFPKVAKGLRGIIAVVEREGLVKRADKISLK